MAKPTTEIITVCAEFNINYRILGDEESKHIIFELKNKFYKGNQAANLWVKNESIYTIFYNSWILLEFLDIEDVVVFFDHRYDENMIRFNNSKDLFKVIRESICYDFFITNSRSDFLISYNDHDVFSVSGSVSEWLIELPYIKNNKMKLVMRKDGFEAVPKNIKDWN